MDNSGSNSGQRATGILSNDTIWCALILCMVTTAVFWQVTGHGFINYDDSDYVYNNAHVLQGVTLPNIVWAFSATEYSNWHPLTWLSHMLDVELFGIAPAGHHLVNLVLHVANTVIMFFLLILLRGTLWQSFAVAALFALHPLHVESVAWVAERKDLLSTFFGLLSMCVYVRYVEQLKSSHYVLAFILFVFSLMSKPMLVTLPFVMLLLDYWPLSRFENYPGTPSLKQRLCVIASLLKEKIPFFVLSAISSVVTIYAQQKGGSVLSLTHSPLSFRLANAIVSYVEYLGKTFWPLNLGVLYPYPLSLPLWKTGVAAALLAAISIFVVYERYRRKYLVVGWCWYLGTLVPVIGIMQVGSQAMADRYTYLPLSGIFIMVVWGCSEIAGKGGFRRILLAVVAGLALSVCIIMTRQQVSLWQNNFTLYSHTLAVTRDNYIIHNDLGYALNADNRIAEAMQHFQEAIRINPQYASAYINMGNCLFRLGMFDNAMLYLDKAIQLKPDSAPAYNEKGAVLLLQGKFDEAADYLSTAIRINPNSAGSHFNQGLAYEKAGKPEQAVKSYVNALQLKSDYVDCHYNLAVILASQKRYSDAAFHFSEVVRLKPGSEIAYKAQQKYKQFANSEKVLW